MSHLKRNTIFAALLSLIFAKAALAEPLQIGEMAPDFNLPNQDGHSIALNNYRGQWVVVYFYPKDDTPGCTTEACSFRDNINRIIAQNATILGISLDAPSSHQAFKDKFQLPFNLLADTTGQTTKRYGALLDLKIMKFAKRQSFIIDPAGRIAKIYRNVDPNNHVREILSDLQQLQMLTKDTTDVIKQP